MRDANAISYMIALMDCYKNVKPETESDKILFNEANKINKEYIDKYYELAKPEIKHYFEISDECDFNSEGILYILSITAEAINELKDSIESEKEKLEKMFLILKLSILKH